LSQPHDFAMRESLALKGKKKTHIRKCLRGKKKYTGKRQKTGAFPANEAKNQGHGTKTASHTNKTRKSAEQRGLKVEGRDKREKRYREMLTGQNSHARTSPN